MRGAMARRVMRAVVWFAAACICVLVVTHTPALADDGIELPFEEDRRPPEQRPAWSLELELEVDAEERERASRAD